MTSQENIIIAIVLVVVILAVIAIGIWRSEAQLSETDKLVRGCWSGLLVNRANEQTKIELLLWSGGNYTIVHKKFTYPVIERGKYTTAAGEGGAVALHLVPDMRGRDIDNFPKLGAPRTHSFTIDSVSGVRVLRFDDGAIYVNTSCDPHTSQV